MDNIAPHFSHCFLTADQVKKLRLYLLDKGYIDGECTEGEFLFLLKGIGEPTNKRIVWKASVTLLSIFVYELSDPLLGPEWTVAGKVFANVKVSSLRDSHNRPFSRDSSRSFDTFFRNQKEVQSVISAL